MNTPSGLTTNQRASFQTAQRAYPFTTMKTSSSIGFVTLILIKIDFITIKAQKRNVLELYLPPKPLLSKNKFSML
jgi:hypothetical protein